MYIQASVVGFCIHPNISIVLDMDTMQSFREARSGTAGCSAGVARRFTYVFFIYYTRSTRKGFKRVTEYDEC